MNEIELNDLYNCQGLTINEIAEKCNLSYSTIRRNLVKYNIKLRKKGDSVNKKYKSAHNKQILTDEQRFLIKDMYEANIPCSKIYKTLNISRRSVDRCVKDMGLKRSKSMFSREQYDSTKDVEIVKLYESGKSSVEISKIMNITHRTVLNHLYHCGVNIRSYSDSLFNFYKKDRPIEIDNPDKLYDLYVVNKFSKKKIGLLLNVAPHVIDRCLRMYGIHVRNCSEAKIGLFNGSNHPNWKGGVTPLYSILREYFSTRQVPNILKRDNYTCQLCGAKKHLQVHHIKHFRDIFYEILSEYPEYDVKEDKDVLYNIFINDERMLDENNLITYCRDCHLYEIHGYEKSNIDV